MYDQYLDILREKLDDYRFNHSLAVAKEAERLATIYGGDVKKAYLAGLLHDITKNFSSKEHLKIFNDFDIILPDIERSSSKLWHAISGSVYVEKVLKISDADIISAIRYHTTAKSNMSLLEKVIYISDFTSEDRKYPDVDIMRELSRKSLEEAMIYALKYTISELLQKEASVHPDTLSAYNYLIMCK